MKKSSIFSLGALSFALVSCGTGSYEPTEFDGSYDPLDGPGQNSNKLKVIEPAYGPSFSPGQFVETIIADAAFYNSKPKGAASADKLLTKGTSMKVVSQSGSYTKVELDSGLVGYVPSIQIDEPRKKVSSSAVDVTPGNNAAETNTFGIPDLPPGSASADDTIDFSDPISIPPKKTTESEATSSTVPKTSPGTPSAEPSVPVDVTPAVPKPDSVPVIPDLEVPELPEPAVE